MSRRRCRPRNCRWTCATSTLTSLQPYMADRFNAALRSGLLSAGGQARRGGANRQADRGALQRQRAGRQRPHGGPHQRRGLPALARAGRDRRRLQHGRGQGAAATGDQQRGAVRLLCARDPQCQWPAQPAGRDGGRRGEGRGGALHQPDAGEPCLGTRGLARRRPQASTGRRAPAGPRPQIRLGGVAIRRATSISRTSSSSRTTRRT